jgi:hypothetical protein
MNKLKCYYAHTMTSYGSTIEQIDIKLLEKLGFEVVNPNQPRFQEECAAYSKKYGWDKVMDYFKKVISEECDMVAFRSLPNGQILSGVAAEVQHAIEKGLPIIELPCSVEKRCMDYPETKRYLIELGHYKV